MYIERKGEVGMRFSDVSDVCMFVYRKILY